LLPLSKCYLQGFIPQVRGRNTKIERGQGGRKRTGVGIIHIGRATQGEPTGRYSWLDGKCPRVRLRGPHPEGGPFDKLRRGLIEINTLNRETRCRRRPRTQESRGGEPRWRATAPRVKGRSGGRNRALVLASVRGTARSPRTLTGVSQCRVEDTEDTLRKASPAI
jgi:hypothetical protein